jgi:hypothetical protein
VGGGRRRGESQVSPPARIFGKRIKIDKTKYTTYYYHSIVFGTIYV